MQSKFFWPMAAALLMAVAAPIALAQSVSAARSEADARFRQTEIGKLVFAEIFVPEPPTVFSADGTRHLSHELFITNASGKPWAVRRIQVIAGEQVLLDASGDALRGAITRWPPVADGAGSDVTLLPHAARVIFYAWVDLPKDGSAPREITHRVTFEPADGGAALTIETDPVAVKSGLVLTAPPFRGTNWVAAAGPSNSSRHRRGVLPLGGVPRVPQRFAIDWLQVDSLGNTFHGDGSVNENYYAFGEEVHAIVGGTVTEVKDGVADNTPGRWPGEGITLETVAGNHVLIDVGGNRWVMYAHLKQGSVRVKSGDRIVVGQVLGLLGNSGNTPEPHLHLQLMDRNSPLGGQGLPFTMREFTVLGKALLAFGGAKVPGAPKADWLARPDIRRNETPLENVIVKFPDP